MMIPNTLTPYQRLIVAIDKWGKDEKPITTEVQFANTMRILRPLVDKGCIVKLRGPHLFRFKMDFLAEQGLTGRNIMGDTKIHDIGASMLDDVQFFSEELKATLFTFHASASDSALAMLKENWSPESHGVGVTVLTDMEADDCLSRCQRLPLDQVLFLVDKTRKLGGCTYTVCSPEEAAEVHRNFPDQHLITPGIRPAGTNANDQKRINTPKVAIQRGASRLVVGRPICGADDPVAMGERIVEEIAEALAA